MFLTAAQGCVYVRPSEDVFIIGMIPIQVAETHVFRDLTDSESNEDRGLTGKTPWTQPHCLITDTLPVSVCTKISSVRQLTMDPLKLNNILYAPPCCSFFLSHEESDYAHELNPTYGPDIYIGIRDFGYYMVGGTVGPERLFYTICRLGGAEFLKRTSAREPGICKNHG